MSIAALITWIVTALGGAYMLRVWLARGGVRQQQTGRTRFPASVVFGHFLLAAAGLVIWIIYLAADSTVLAWVAFAVLVPVALLGFAMFGRWLAARRSPVAAGAAAAADPEAPAEQAFPVPVVVAHGLLAVVTVVLVLLTAAGVGGS